MVGGPALRGIDEVEHLLVIPLPLRELPVVVAECDPLVATNDVLDRRIAVEERSADPERLVDELVEAVTLEQEEPVRSAGVVERGERGRASDR